ncbi:MAG: LamG domain-containing protein, partial [Phycisphaerae bacterium]
MYKRLICLISFVLVLSVAGNASADLVAHWPLDEGSGTTAIDLSGNGHDGTIGGTANWVPGQTGLALDFDGSSTYIDMDDRVVEGTWSLAMWLKPRDIPYTSADQDYYAVMHTDAWSTGAMHLHLRQNTSLLNADFNSGPDVTSTTVLQENEWYHAVVTVTDEGDIASRLYLNGVLEAEGTGGSGGDFLGPLNFGSWNNSGRNYHGLMDDIRIYDHVLSEIEIMGAMAGEIWPYAWGPEPADGAIHADTWVNISWKPGGFAVSHDVYLGENFDDVDAGAEAAFQGNQAATFLVAGFPGFPYPDGLVPGTTYYWRIDEVNDTEPNSPWKGDIWSFMIPPKTAYAPDPADAAEQVDLDANLKWVGGFGAKLHTVYFGDNFDDVNNAAGGLPQGATNYNPGTLKLAKTYYWRVDEFDAIETYKGHVWSFTTEGAVGDPNPANGAVDVKQTQIITWSPSVFAASHELYFGTDKDAVKNADTGSPEYKGTRDLGAETYDPGMLAWDTTYYWRIDEVNNANPDSPWP